MESALCGASPRAQAREKMIQNEGSIIYVSTSVVAIAINSLSALKGGFRRIFLSAGVFFSTARKYRTVLNRSPIRGISLSG